MIQYLNNLLAKIRFRLQFDSARFKLIHTTEKFDVVERAPVYKRTVYLNGDVRE